MKKVEVVLPRGLELTKPGWDKPKVPEPDLHSAADEQLLLDKITDGARQRSGDSSGCSSGHESVASSDTTSHISGSSDSGTEQPRSPSGELRQRAVGTPRFAAVKDYVFMPSETNTPTWSSKSPPSPGNYCVLGVDPGTSNTSAAPPQDMMTIPYISCDSAPASTPYVLTGDVSKSANPGYIPFSSAEPVEKNTGYVVAGSKSMLMPDLLQRETGKNVMPKYVQVAEKPGDAAVWTQSPGEAPVNKTGYVSIGDVSTVMRVSPEHSKGYVPHRHFDGKTLKED